MFAVYAESFAPDDPLSALSVGERPDPTPPDGWTTIDVKAAALNHHDLWSLRGGTGWLVVRCASTGR